VRTVTTTTTTVAPNCDNDNDKGWGSSLDREMREELKMNLRLELLVRFFFDYCILMFIYK
jgi:hypothetical protein